MSGIRATQKVGAAAQSCMRVAFISFKKLLLTCVRSELPTADFAQLFLGFVKCDFIQIWAFPLTSISVMMVDAVRQLWKLWLFGCLLEEFLDQPVTCDHMHAARKLLDHFLAMFLCLFQLAFLLQTFCFTEKEHSCVAHATRSWKLATCSTRLSPLEGPDMMLPIPIAVCCLPNLLTGFESCGGLSNSC
jgi:hypothetical protein